jgi:hypothetical protein
MICCSLACFVANTGPLPSHADIRMNERSAMRVKRLRVGLLLVAGMHLALPVQAHDEPQPLPGAVPLSVRPAVPNLDLVHRFPKETERVSFAGVPSALQPAGAQNARSSSKLAAAISAAGNVDMVQGGVAGSKWALLECQRGDYPGGGMGVLSLPFGRPSARTDHCWH